MSPVSARTSHWRVEHCVGPLGLGTLIVKPQRHVTSVPGLTDPEALELGPLLRTSSAVAGELVGAEQIYNCLWSHAGGVPGHIHHVIQPVTTEQVAEVYGPALQMRMFAAGDTPPMTTHSYGSRWSSATMRPCGPVERYEAQVTGDAALGETAPAPLDRGRVVSRHGVGVEAEDQDRRRATSSFSAADTASRYACAVSRVQACEAIWGAWGPSC